MRRTAFFINKVCILFIIIALALPGCSQNKQQHKLQQQSAQDQEDKIPEQLKSLEGNIEKIFKTLEEPTGTIEGDSSKKDQQQSGKENQSGGKKQEQGSEGSKESDKGGEDKKGSEQGGEGDSDQKQEQPSPSPSPSPSPQPNQQGQKQGQGQEDKWTQILSTVHNLHYQWNDYMPSAASKGASRTLVDNFSNTLNSLTNVVVSKNRTGTLMVSNELYGLIPDFCQLYKTKTSPEIKRIRYYTRNIMLKAEASDWAQAEADINSLKSSWSMYKTTVPKDQNDNANKLDYSISELENVVKEKSKSLTDIKGRVAMSNINTLESGMEKASEQQGQSGQQK